MEISLRKTLFLAGAIGILVIVMIVSALNRAAGQGQEGVAGQEQPRSVPAATPNTIGAPSLHSADRDEIPQVIQQFVTAYATHSWEDPKASAWLEKTSRFTTASYQNSLIDEFGGIDDSSSWAAFKREQTKTSTEGITAVLVGGAGGEATVIVDYDVRTTNRGTAGGQPEHYHRMATLKHTGVGWLVDSFNDVVGVPVPPSNPPVSPPLVVPSVGD